MEERAQIPPLYSGASFDNFVVPGPDNPIGRQGLAQARIAVSGYSDDFPNVSPPGLLLIGEPGTGKTHLAVAALRRIIRKGFEALFCDYQNLLDRIRKGFDATSNTSDKEAYQLALDIEVLLIDDLGAHRTLDWVQDTITSIITYRCNHRKALIATTNLPDPAAGSRTIERNAVGQPELRRTLSEHLGERARSRLFEMCTVVRMPLVEDHRLRKARTF